MSGLRDITGEDLVQLLLDESSQVPPLDRSRRIFVNRTLRMDRIDVVGFDMDYTLAIYRKERIEQLAFARTIDKLVGLGYPEGIREVRYEPDRVIRGLLIDKPRGHIVKMDRYGHVGRAYHGSRALTREERVACYRARKVNPGSPDYEWIDTLFSLPEGCLYCQLVDWLDAHAGELDRVPSYLELARDVRQAIDEAHADGSIKKEVRAHPERYIEGSGQELAFALHRLRSSGKRLFVLTNSYWPYTDDVMRYLLDGVLEGYPSWRNYFDLVIVGARKPGFFERGSPFTEVCPRTGTLKAEPAARLEKGRVYQGGNLKALEAKGGIGGETVLYVGDHIYGDILLSKKTSLWRTCMIVPELEDVIWHEELYGPDLWRLGVLYEDIERTDYGINYYKLLLNRIAKLREHSGGNGDGPMSDEELAATETASVRARRALDSLRRHQRTQLAAFRECEAQVDHGYNPHWGRLFIEGTETSLFGQQVENFACLYTSRVSNFAYYSPTQYFRSLPERLPHARSH